MSSESFFKAVLGEAATGALMKAGERSPALASALLPRGVLAWLSFASNWNYEGEVPGLPDSYMEFAKSGQDSYDGFIAVGEHQYEFHGASLLHMAASVSVALGGAQVDTGIKQADIQALGKNLDLLVKTRYLNLMQKAEERKCEECGGNKVNTYDSAVKDDVWRCPKCEADTRKTELPGKAHAPTAPEEPNAGEPQKKQPKRQQPPRAVTLTRSEAESPCTVCDEPQFKDGKFTACYCLRDLAKHAKAEAKGETYTIVFDREWSDLDVALFRDIAKGNV